MCLEGIINIIIYANVLIWSSPFSGLGSKVLYFMLNEFQTTLRCEKILHLFIIYLSTTISISIYFYIYLIYISIDIDKYLCVYIYTYVSIHIHMYRYIFFQVNLLRPLKSHRII